jgi:hypothetical protein
MILQRAKVRNKEDSSVLSGSESVVKNEIKDKLCSSLAVIVLCALLFPFCVSAQCGECDDKNPCTEDYCNGTQCLHAPKSCGDGSPSTWKPFGLMANFSTPEKIGNFNTNISMPSNNGAVFNAAVSCNDGNPCTTDYYGANGCVHDPVNCDDQNPCTTDYCGANGCVHDPVNCDDQNPCTTDYCGPNGCVHDPLICDDGNAGIAEASGSCGCGNALPSSDNGNASSFETEELGFNETEIGYIVNDSTLDSCEAGACVNEPIVIDSGNNSTFESLNQGFSARHPPNCDDNDSCTIDTFNGKTCVHTQKDCDDKNASTFDYCFEGKCFHIQTSCDDGKPCTTDSYNGSACEHTSRNCDDGKPCTADSCDPVRGCKHVSKCDDGNPCTVDYCDSVRGCRHAPVVCGNGKTCIDGFCLYPYAYPYFYPYAEPYNQPTKSYTIPAGTAITLPWGAKATALDSLKVENGIAYSTVSPLRFVRDLGQNQAVSGYQSNLLISDQAEMIGLSWQTSTFTVVLIQPDGSVLPLKGDNLNVMHLMGSNYDYYYLRSPAKGNWNVEIRPANPGTGDEGFSLITGLVRGAAPLPSA